MHFQIEFYLIVVHNVSNHLIYMALTEFLEYLSICFSGTYQVFAWPPISSSTWSKACVRSTRKRVQGFFSQTFRDICHSWGWWHNLLEKIWRLYVKIGRKWTNRISRIDHSQTRSPGNQLPVEYHTRTSRINRGWNSASLHSFWSNHASFWSLLKRSNGHPDQKTTGFGDIYQDAFTPVSCQQWMGDLDQKSPSQFTITHQNPNQDYCYFTSWRKSATQP